MSQKTEQVTKQEENERPDFGSLIAIGLSLGAGVGVALDNIGAGAGIGLLVATIVNSYYERKEGEKGAGVALALGVTSLFFITVMLLFTH